MVLSPKLPGLVYPRSHGADLYAVPPQIPSFDNAGLEWQERCCASADLHFLRTARALGGVSNNGQVEDYGSDIFHYLGKSILLRKSHPAMTALSLVDILIDGTQYPEGSIMAIRAGSPDNAPSRNRVRILAMEAISQIYFKRSSQFGERPEGWGYGWAERRAIKRTTVGDIGRIVDKAFVRMSD